MKRKIQYRPVSKEDLDLTYSIKTECLKQYIEQIWGWDEKIQRDLHLNRFNLESTRIIISKGLEIGLCEWNYEGGDIEIRNILIKEEFQSQGFGQTVLHDIFRFAKESAAVVRLRVFKINGRAIKFYKKNGFDIIGESAQHHIMEVRF